MGDLPTLKEFEQELINIERRFDTTIQSDPVNYYNICDMIESTDTEVAIAKIDNEIVACGYARIKTARSYTPFERCVIVGFLYVDSAYRGNEIVGKILDHLIKWARKNQLSEVYLEVYPENVSAVHAYEKHGFKPHLLEMRLNLNKIIE